MDELIKALPEPSEDDCLVELKEVVPFIAETDSQHCPFGNCIHNCGRAITDGNVQNVEKLHSMNLFLPFTLYIEGYVISKTIDGHGD